MKYIVVVYRKIFSLHTNARIRVIFINQLKIIELRQC